ncbi:hypothetical protein ACU610_13210 [Geodermatophilus sp. URMC 61]|uniref:hypothetical protein n=1 Tax=Geodermatophilus sp. URMC 61 TaxID=3423411 RepID=UPI00406C7C79
MSRPHRTLDGAPATARAALPEPEAAELDRLAHAVLARPGAALGAALRAVLPGTTGARWLRSEGLPPTTRAADLTAEQWLSLHRCCAAAGHAPGPATAGGRSGRPSAHGHAPGAMAAPRWY